jgi:hypothetical protein
MDSMMAFVPQVDKTMGMFVVLFYFVLSVFNFLIFFIIYYKK